MDFTFRKALPAEGNDVDRVLRSAFTPYVRKLGREVTADYYAWVGAAIERDDVFVAAETDKVVGVAVTERRDSGLYVDRLGVDPARSVAVTPCTCPPLSPPWLRDRGRGPPGTVRTITCASTWRSGSKRPSATAAPPRRHPARGSWRRD
jgi:hypothetical protein